jgi:hypothetical protein
MDSEALFLGMFAPQAGVVGTASATILPELVVTGRTPLTFGVIESASSDGEIIITPQNKRIINGQIQVSHTDPFESAHFNIRGQANEMYNIHVPTTLTFIREGGVHSNGISSLEVNNFVSYSENSGEASSKGTLDDKGLDAVHVGGTLVVPINVSPGRYSGEVPLTVTY